MPVVPTNYNNKPTAVSADSVWGYDSEGVANVNFTMAVIMAYIFSNSSTSDLSEGTNKYYTEARVNANSTVTSKADKSNVLELDNTDTFTPDGDYEPATKKYVDDATAGVGIAQEVILANISSASTTTISHSLGIVPNLIQVKQNQGDNNGRFPGYWTPSTQEAIRYNVVVAGVAGSSSSRTTTISNVTSTSFDVTTTGLLGLYFKLS